MIQKMKNVANENAYMVLPFLTIKAYRVNLINKVIIIIFPYTSLPSLPQVEGQSTVFLLLLKQKLYQWYVCSCRQIRLTEHECFKIRV